MSPEEQLRQGVETNDEVFENFVKTQGAEAGQALGFLVNNYQVVNVLGLLSGGFNTPAVNGVLQLLAANTSAYLKAAGMEHRSDELHKLAQGVAARFLVRK